MGALNKAELKAIKERLEKITQGQWIVRSMGHDCFVEAPEPPERKFGYAIEILGDDDNGYPTKRADCEFISHAPNDIAKLIDALEKTCQL